MKKRGEKVVLELDSNIQNGFVDEDKVLPVVHKSIELGFNCGFRGPTGCGKTFLVQELAKQYGKKLSILNMTVDTEVEEIKGRLVPKYNKDTKELEFKWINGVLVDAMLYGHWLVIEEANFMNEELASVFYSVMDHRRNIQLDEHENELIKAHEDFRLFLTMNWGYKGTTQPNDAIRNRIDAWFDLKYLSQDKETDLLVQRTTRNGESIDKSVAYKIADIANQFRKRDPSENLPDISTRILLRWASMVREGIEPEIAAEYNLIPLLKYDEIEKAKIREIVKTAFEKQEKVLKVTKGKQLDTAVIGDGNTIKAGDPVECTYADGKTETTEVLGIVQSVKNELNPEGIRVILKNGWMPAKQLTLAKK